MSVCVSESEQCRPNSAPLFDPIVSMCALTSQQDWNEEKKTNLIPRHCRHGGRSSQNLCCAHRSAHLFLVVPLVLIAIARNVLFYRFRPEQRDKSQVKWTVLLTMKLESVGIWHSHHMSGQTETSIQQQQGTMTARRNEILIAKIRSLMHRPRHIAQCGSVREWMASSCSVSIGQALRYFYFIFFSYENSWAMPFNAMLRRNFKNVKHLLLVMVMLDGGKRPIQHNFLFSFQWHQSLNGRTRSFD